MSNKIAEIVTAKILNRLDQGVIPWRRQWNILSDIPRNLVSNRPYTGVNVWLLESEHKSPFWLTYKQATDLGGNIKKGENSSMIVYWKVSLFKDETSEDETVARRIPLLRYYNVFNLEQTENIKLPKHAKEYEEFIAGKIIEFNPIDKAEEVVEAYTNKPVILHRNQEKAYYSHTKDQVVLPLKESFISSEAYYSVLFHELGHSTGATHRLKRRSLETYNKFGDYEYSKEELVAELTASMLNAYCNFDSTLDNSTAYLQSWMSALKNDKNLFITASQLAQRSYEYILGDLLSEQELESELEMVI